MVPLEQLERGLDRIRSAPRESGKVELIVRRPRVGEREVLQEAVLSLEDGLVGDSWRARHAAGGSADPEMQLNIMNARAIALIAGEKERWPPAGDQLYVDLDLSTENLWPGIRLAVGGAVIEVTGKPHLGCAKFRHRFGADALTFVNSPLGRQLRLRGLNARVVFGGVIRSGDAIARL